MQRVFNIDKKLKNKYLKEWAKTQDGYKIRRFTAIFLKVLGGVIFLGLSLLFGCLTYGTDVFATALLLGIGLGFGFGCIPFFIGQSIGIKAVLKCGRPFSIEEKESILIADEGIEFRYHDVETPFEMSVSVYQILREDVRVIAVDDATHVATIIGRGNMTVYHDIATKKIDWTRSQRRFYEDSQMKILLAYGNNDELIQKLKNYASLK